MQIVCAFVCEFDGPYLRSAYLGGFDYHVYKPFIGVKSFIGCKHLISRCAPVNVEAIELHSYVRAS